MGESVTKKVGITITAGALEICKQALRENNYTEYEVKPIGTGFNVVTVVVPIKEPAKAVTRILRAAIRKSKVSANKDKKTL